MKKKKAQSILEYILVLAAIITAVILATSGPDSVVQSSIGSMFDESSGVITEKSETFSSKIAGGPGL